MTDNYELVGSIRRSLHDIRTHWDAMLVPTSSTGQGGSASARIQLDDHDPSEVDIDRTTRVVSLRRFTTDILNGWSRVVMEDRPVTKALPNGHNVPSMVEFLERHAEWLSEQEVATDCAGELEDVAKRITGLVVPHRKEWHHLGPCPLGVEFNPEEGVEACGGRVRVPIGGDQSEATCARCGEKAAIRWWEERMGVVDEIVGAADMARILFESLHVRVTERTVRNWGRQGRVTKFVPFGPQPKDDEPRWWFAARSVLDEVARMDRQCPACGRLWSGTGDACSRCWHAMQDARPRYAERKVATPAAVNIRPVRVVPDSHDLDRPERCHWSDLPVDQCACGRIHAKIGA